jgi:replicative DNA helicase
VLDVRLRPADFYRERHRLIFRAMLRLAERRDAAVDAVTVSEELERAAASSTSRAAGYVHSLPNLVPSAGNVRHYAQIVRDHSAAAAAARRRPRAAGRGSHRGVAGRAARGARARAARGRGHRDRAELSIEQRQHDLVDHVERGDTGSVGSLAVQADLNEMTGGIWPGHLTVLGGVTRHGKSVIADQVLSARERRGARGSRWRPT